MSNNLAIWNAVSKTDPTFTKHVNQRGGFTAIAAHYQVMRATEQFGPVGIGWGYTNGAPIFHESLVFVPVTIWHGSRDNHFGPIYGGAEWKSPKGYVDSDGVKKAATDGLTKALSHIGFNADVFLGRFDDNKYVAELRKEAASANDHTDSSVDALLRLIGECQTDQALKTLWAAHADFVKASPQREMLTKAKDAQKAAILTAAQIAA